MIMQVSAAYLVRVEVGGDSPGLWHEECKNLECGLRQNREYLTLSPIWWWKLSYSGWFYFVSSLTVNGEVVYSILSVYVKCSGLGSVSCTYLMWSSLLLDLKLIEFGGASLKNAKVGDSARF